MSHNTGVEEYRPLLTIVAPAYNEQEVLPEFHRRVSAVLDTLDVPAEILYVNDGSTDATLSVIRQLHADDRRVSLIDLSRNFGKEIAMTAGFDHARGEAVIVIDTDLQDPPELIPEMIRLWKAGHDVVYAQRESREGETWLKKATAHCFYRLIDRVAHVRVPRDTGDYRLLSQRAVQALRQIKEHHRFMKGLFAWVGFNQIAVPYRRDARYAGVSKWNYWKLWNFALEGITSFTTVPLRFATYLGLGTAALAFSYAVFVFWKALMYGDRVHGYPSLMIVILFLGGVQLMTLGVIGEYVGRTFNETKGRPLYFTNQVSLGTTNRQKAECPSGE
ncbi:MULTISPECIES: glycosyltransferase family 2 protein [Paraburkholderia]|jgi:glycosyltransferase involved in cell wall biosynthesis|uniref:Glycosyltransferase involved in cell wall bisynthesis n=1 Tax=Paraburkholderia phenazinium TaxID=60549 RepID=A0A1N6LGK1_9BURK|nr:glycosyltransferase family 2 protein [Paraburkholderia phenazinium]SIO67873.1 Glycosyltransferase involved in cell wall bisynthesis [Paraburkholderia phenazinium]